MKKNLKLLSVVPILALSCIEAELPSGQPCIPCGDEVVVPIDLSCELLDTEYDDASAKSRHDMSALRRITNANYYVFRDGALECQGYCENTGDFAVALPSREGEYNLYILANVGEIALERSVKEADMPTAVHVDYGSANKYFNVIENDGFPMSTVVSGFSASFSGGLKLKRLVHTLYVKADTGSLDAMEMKFTGLSVKNAARDVFPFAQQSRAQYVMDGDSAAMSNEDMDALNSGETVTLYVLENVRGDLFPGNTNWKKKIPENMKPVTEQKYATYIELTAEVQTPTALYSCNTYRAYLGTSAEDCNVVRHSYFNLNNYFTNDMIKDDGWRIENDNPVINQTLAFVKGSTGKAAISEAMTYPGFVKEFYVYRSNPNINFTLKSDDSEGERIWFSTEKVDDFYTRVKLNTTMAWTDNGTISEKLTLMSSDGLITKTLTAKANAGSSSSQAGITITPSCDYLYFPGGEEEHTNNIILRTSTEFLEPVEIRITAGGRMDGYLKTWPDGTNNTPVEQKFSADISDTYSNYVGTTPVDFRFYLYQYFNKIGNNSSESSLNRNNGKDWFYKHAHPTDLQLTYQVEFGKSKDGSLYPAGPSTVVPIHIESQQIVKPAGAEPYGAGTDWGILFWHDDDKGANWPNHGGDVLFIRYKRSIYGTINTYEENLRTYTEQRIGVKFNGIDEWTDNLPKATYL